MAQRLVVGRASYELFYDSVLQIHHPDVRPVLGDRFDVLGRLVRAGRSLVFAAADLHDESGQLCARCDDIVAVAGEPAAEAEERIAL